MESKDENPTTMATGSVAGGAGGAQPGPKDPATMVDTMVATARAKASIPLGRMFLRAMAAGLFIGLGASAMLLVKADGDLGFTASQWVGGVVFSLGLVLVLVAGAELFTGNSLMVMGLLGGSTGWKGLLRNWGVVLLGNLVGALVLVALLAGAGFATQNGGALGMAAAKVAITKTGLPWLTVFFRAVLCNLLVCLAVWMAQAAVSVTDKVLCALIPVAAFVALGFEHCVANFFFLPFGALCAATAGPGAVQGAITAAGMAQNLSAAVLGNVVGGALLVGVFYWAAYGKGKGSKA